MTRAPPTVRGLPVGRKDQRRGRGPGTAGQVGSVTGRATQIADPVDARAYSDLDPGVASARADRATGASVRRPASRRTRRAVQRRQKWAVPKRAASAGGGTASAELGVDDEPRVAVPAHDPAVRGGATCVTASAISAGGADPHGPAGQMEPAPSITIDCPLMLVCSSSSIRTTGTTSSGVVEPTRRGTAQDRVELGLAEHRRHLRGEEPRRHSVGQDPTGELPGDRAGRGVEAALGRGVRHQAGVAALPTDRGHVDQPAAAALAEQPAQPEAGEHQRRGQVGRR